MLKARQPSTNSNQSTYKGKLTGNNTGKIDTDVDTSDIPEQTDEDWLKFEENLFYRPKVIFTKSSS